MSVLSCCCCCCCCWVSAKVYSRKCRSTTGSIIFYIHGGQDNKGVARVDLGEKEERIFGEKRGWGAKVSLKGKDYVTLDSVDMRLVPPSVLDYLEDYLKETK